MADSICLAIDAMGGDFGPRITVPAAVEFLHRHPQAHATLLGDEPEIRAHLKCSDSIKSRLAVKHCSQVVGMDEKPLAALRKRESSMWMAVSEVASGHAHACISAGNTGALLATGITQLERFAGVERPAICTAIPSLGKRTWLLDAGANLECSPAQLHQFARMATCLVASVDGIARPSVGLLNVGAEHAKGSKELQEAAALLAADNTLNYTGFVEGDGLYLGNRDIVECDGFSGNVALKAGEGVARMVASRLHESFHRSLRARLAGWISRGVLRRFQRDIDPSAYNGASFLGLCGVVVKSHGSAHRESFIRALEVAKGEAESNLPDRLEKALLAKSE